jgi:hypothetical protein
LFFLFLLTICLSLLEEQAKISTSFVDFSAFRP